MLGHINFRSLHGSRRATHRVAACLNFPVSRTLCQHLNFDTLTLLVLVATSHGNKIEDIEPSAMSELYIEVAVESVDCNSAWYVKNDAAVCGSLIIAHRTVCHSATAHGTSSPVH